MTIQLKRNDTKDTISYTVTNLDGSVVNLTGATVKFVMGKGKTLITNAAATVDNATTGEVSYTLIDADTLVAGTFNAEFEVTFSDGKIKTYPNNGYIMVNIQANIDKDLSTYIEDNIAYRVSEIQILKNEVQAQLDQFAVGATNEETAQARVESDGTTNTTLKARLDKKEAEFKAFKETTTTNLAQIVPLAPNGTDDTANINNAITSLSSKGGGTLKLTSGTYTYSQIRLKKGVYIEGVGDGTVLKVKVGTTTDSVILDSDSVSQCGLFNLLIDGDKANNTASRVLYLNRATIPAGSEFDTHFRLSHVKIKNGYGDGLVINTNSREGRFDNIAIFGCNGIGLNNIAGTDNFFTNGVCFANKGGGVKDTSSNNRYTTWKCFGNGDLTNRNAGFLISSRKTNTFVACDAQENYGHGFYILNANNIDLIGCTADANGITGTDQTLPSDLLYNGFEVVNSNRINISGRAYDFRKEANGASTQNIGVHIDTNCSKVTVDIASQYQQSNVVSDSWSYYKSIYATVNGLPITPNYIYATNGDNILNFMTADPDNSPKTHWTFGERKSDNSIRLVLNDLNGNYIGTALNIDVNGNVAVGMGPGNLMFGNGPTKNLGFYGSTGIAKPTLVADATDLATAITLINDLKAKLKAFGLVN